MKNYLRFQYTRKFYLGYSHSKAINLWNCTYCWLYSKVVVLKCNFPNSRQVKYSLENTEIPWSLCSVLLSFQSIFRLKDYGPTHELYFLNPTIDIILNFWIPVFKYHLLSIWYLQFESYWCFITHFVHLLTSSNEHMKQDQSLASSRMLEKIQNLF